LTHSIHFDFRKHQQLFPAPISIVPNESGEHFHEGFLKDDNTVSLQPLTISIISFVTAHYVAKNQKLFAHRLTSGKSELIACTVCSTSICPPSGLTLLACGWPL